MTVGIERLKLLIVGTYPPPYGGIATHLTSLIPGLKLRGADDIAVLSFSDTTAVEARDGFTLYRCNVRGHLSALANPRFWLLAARTIASLLPHGFSPRLIVRETVKAVLVDQIAAKHRSNVVSFYQCDMNMQLPALARTWKGRKAIVLSVFGEIYEAASSRLIREHARFFRNIFTFPAAVVSSSCYCSRAYEVIGVDRSIEPVYYGVETTNVTSRELRSRFRSQHRIGEHEIVVLFMGRFSKEMGIDVLLDAGDELLAKSAALRLVIAGARGEHSRQAEQLAAARPDRVLVLQDVPFSKQAEIYSAADVFVAPSFNQRACMGMAIKEAMAAALPVIGGAGGGVPEAVVEGETGFLVPVGSGGRVDVAQFVERILRLANEPAMRAQFGRAGRQRAERMFSYETTNRRMAEIFLSALSTPTASRTQVLG